MSGSSNEVSYTFYSENLDKLNQTVKKVEDLMNNNDDLKDVSSSAEDAYVEYTFRVEQGNLLKYGLTTGQLVGMLSPQKTKDVLTTVEKDGDSLDVVVQQEQAAQPESINDILDKQIPTALGKTMPLSELVKVKKGTTLNTLARSKGEYYATVSGKVKGKDVFKSNCGYW